MGNKVSVATLIGYVVCLFPLLLSHSIHTINEHLICIFHSGMYKPNLSGNIDECNNNLIISLGTIYDPHVMVSVLAYKLKYFSNYKNFIHFQQLKYK